MGVFDFLTKGGPGRTGGDEPPIGKETRTYEELMDELMTWNIEQTDILEVLRKEVDEIRLKNWSDALGEGIRKNLSFFSGNEKENPFISVYLDLYHFVKGLRTKLLADPTMKNAKRAGKTDSLSICIICGIRALQKEKGLGKLMDSLQWMMLERYLG